MLFRSANWQEYEDFVNLLARTGSIVESTQIWWSIRPHHNFGTIEVRIADGQTEMSEALAVTALSLALVARFAADYDAEIARYSSMGYEIAFSGSNRDMRFAYFDTSKDLGVMIEVLEDVASVREAFARIKQAGDNWDGTDLIRGSAQQAPTT